MLKHIEWTSKRGRRRSGRYLCLSVVRARDSACTLFYICCYKSNSWYNFSPNLNPRKPRQNGTIWRTKSCVPKSKEWRRWWISINEQHASFKMLSLPPCKMQKHKTSLLLQTSLFKSDFCLDSWLWLTSLREQKVPWATISLSTKGLWILSRLMSSLKKDWTMSSWNARDSHCLLDNKTIS